VFGPHQPIQFNDVILNVGGAYDPRHGIFRAPVSGVYQFALTFLNAERHDATFEIVKDGVRLGYSYSDSDNYNSGVVEINVRVEAGEDVWCRCASVYNSFLNPQGKYSCFSGHIIP
jgi:hypothetical protein